MNTILKNGYFKIVAGIVLGIIITATLAYAYKGYDSYSKSEQEDKFVSKEIYENDQEYMKETLKDIKDTQKDIQEDIKELLERVD